MESSLASSLTRKARQVLETKTDDETLLQSLTALSRLNENEKTRVLESQQLSAAIETGSVQRATDILQLASTVMQQLNALKKGVAGLSACSDRIQKEVETCNAAIKPYLDSIESLEIAEKLNEEKEKLVDDFLQRYQLLPEEAELLERGDVNEDFFKTLQRAQGIHSNCKNLLRTQHQRAGLELMDTMARYQETAFKRLVQWIQTKCQDLVDVEAAELNPLMQRALKAISSRPVLYRYCAEEVSEARRDALFERFVSSLSQGPRPIEMQSDDPKRYVNDMLAWVHQSLASEMELLELLFADASRVHQEQIQELPSITALLGRVFHGIDRPLKVRIEQVLMLPPHPVLCYELACLLDFYVGTIRDVAGQSFALTESLQNCLDMAARTLHEQIHSRGIRLNRNPLVVPRDLSPPAEVSDTVQFISKLLNAGDNVLKASTTREGLSLSTIISSVLDPLLTACRKCASDLELTSIHQESHPTRVILSKNVFLINTLEALAAVLKGRADTAERYQQLSNDLQLQSQNLAKEIASALLSRCEVTSTLNRMKEYERGGSSDRTMAEDPSLKLPIVAQAMRSFFDFVSEAESLPEFVEIIDVEVRSEAVRVMCETLADAYEQMWNAVSDPQNGYGQKGSSLEQMEHSPDEIRTILSLK